MAGDRLQVYPVTPTVSYLSVQEASQSVSNAIESDATLRELVVNVNEDEAGKAVRVGTPNVAQVESILHEMLGPNPAIAVEYDASGGSLLSGRSRNSGRMRASDAILSKFYHVTQPPKQVNGYCTAGFGAKDKAGEQRGQAIWRLFVLTAGHCNEVVEPRVYRSNELNLETGHEGNWKEIGKVTRNALHQPDRVSTDAEAIRLHDAGIVPNGIYGWMGKSLPTEKAGKARIGDVLCFSGVTTGAPECGRVVARSTHWTGAGDGHARGGYWGSVRIGTLQERNMGEVASVRPPVYCAPGASCTIQAAFSPTETGFHFGELQISDNAARGAQIVPLQAIGVGPSVLHPPPLAIFISQRPHKVSTRRFATFRFGLAGVHVRFVCKLDRRPFRPCISPTTYRNLAFGHHVFKVKTRSRTPAVSPAPAVARFQVIPLIASAV